MTTILMCQHADVMEFPALSDDFVVESGKWCRNCGAIWLPYEHERKWATPKGWLASSVTGGGAAIEMKKEEQHG